MIGTSIAFRRLPAPFGMPDMAIDTVAALSDALTKNRLLDATQFTQMARWQARFLDPRALARELLGRGWLTPYQINQLFQGNGRDLVLGSYILLERLGEGGMGQVFKAKHQKLGRIVALKVVRKEKLADPELVGRFRREMQAVAQLSHPNVVSAIDADQTDDALFFSMEYVEGIDLSRLVKERGPLPIDKACDYIRQAALGLEHAYERGLVHRDIKPSNLFLTDGVVKILDLGLARLQDPGGEGEGLTQMGVIIGTPDYISPEQARNSRTADIRSDLYSLGCTFYFLLTGRAPFAGDTATEKLLHHCFDEPTPVEKLRPGIPPRIVKIVQKLMAKKPDDRYPTPAKLVIALSRPGVLSATWSRKPLSKFLRTVMGTKPPIRPDAPERLRKAADRRRWLQLGIFGGGVLLILLAFTVIFWATRSPATATRKATAPDTALGRLPLDQLDAKAIPPEEHFPWQPKELVAVLGKHRGRSWGMINFLAVSPDGQLAAGVGADGLPQLWETATLRSRGVLHDDTSGHILCLAFAPDGRSLACGSTDGVINLWDIGRAKPEKKAILRAHASAVNALAFAPNGQTLASGSADDTVRLWDLTRPDRPEVMVLRGHDGPVLTLAFAPDSKTLASGSKDTTVRLWLVNGAGSTERFVLTGHVGPVNLLAFVAKGDRLFSSSGGQGVRIWDTSDGKQLNYFELIKSGNALGVFAPDGRVLLSTAGPNQPVHIWDLTASPPQDRGSLPGSTSWLSALAFSADGKRLVAAGNHRLQVWDAVALPAKPKLLSPLDEGVDVRAVAVTKDGRTLAGGGYGGRLRLWDLAGAVPAETALFDAHSRIITAIRFSPDAKQLASGASDGSLRLWDLAAKPKESAPIPGFNQSVTGLAFTADGKVLAAGGAEFPASLRLYDLVSGKASLRDPPLVRGDPVNLMAMDGRGHALVAAGRDQTVRVWDITATPAAVRGEFRLARRIASALAVSTDGHTAAVGTNAGTIKLADLSAGEPRDRGELTLPQAHGSVHALAFAPAGDVFAASYSDRLVIWDLATLRVLRDWEMPGGAADLCFGPDGRHLIIANGNGTIYVLRLAAPWFRTHP
jgi:WD40 repeat protein/serine/threonine protein kinase